MATKLERERRKLERLPPTITSSTILAGVKRPTRECREAVLKLAKIPKSIDENNDKVDSWMKTGSRPSSTTSTRASASSGSRATSSERVKLQPNALAMLPVKKEEKEEEEEEYEPPWKKDEEAFRNRPPSKHSKEDKNTGGILV